MATSFARDNICSDGTEVVNEPIQGERRGLMQIYSPTTKTVDRRIQT